MAVDLDKVDAVGDVVHGWASCDIITMRAKAARAIGLIEEFTGETKKRAAMLAQPLMAFLERKGHEEPSNIGAQVHTRLKRAA